MPIPGIKKARPVSQSQPMEGMSSRKTTMDMAGTYQKNMRLYFCQKRARPSICFMFGVLS